MSEMTLPGLVAELVDLRHAGGYRFKVPERVLRQFAAYCRREGYPDGSITKEALDGFLYGCHLRVSTVRRNELVLRQLAEHAEAAGWDAYIPVAATRVRVRHQVPYVLTDDEVRRLFTVIDSQPMSSFTNKSLVDPVLFRVLYGAGLRVSEVLNLTLSDVDTRAGTLKIRDSKNGESRTIPITNRLTATLEGYIVAAHPVGERGAHVFYSRTAGSRPAPGTAVPGLAGGRTGLFGGYPQPTPRGDQVVQPLHRRRAARTPRSGHPDPRYQAEEEPGTGSGAPDR